MTIRIKINIAIVLLLMTWHSSGQEKPAGMVYHLFTDRNSCISGDTVWFKAFIPRDNANSSDILHVQLDSPDGTVITNVMKESYHGMAEGYVPVPDSLRTGTYFLKAFLRHYAGENVAESPLLVYNRFDEEFRTLMLPHNIKLSPFTDYSGKIKIGLEKSAAKTRDSLRIKIQIEEGSGISEFTVRIARIDPLADRLKGYLLSPEVNILPAALRNFQEKKGFLLNGKVVEAQSGKPSSKALVMLSIPGKTPYFDYFVTNRSGEFHFFLKGAHGTGNFVVQALDSLDQELKITMSGYSSGMNLQHVLVSVTPSAKEKTFLEENIQADYFRRLFTGSYNFKTDSFRILPQYNTVPFYGKPDFTVVPAEFFDLPDFREVSRELLPGVRYRVKDKKPTFRLVNTLRKDMFETEPFRLINGIPVFENKLITCLKSTDIEYIDYSLKERLFGGLSFKGVLSIILKDQSITWLEGVRNTGIFRVSCLQTERDPGYMKNPGKLPVNNPDLRSVLFWGVADTSREISFRTSDITGEFAIVVQGLSPDHKPFIVEKKFIIE